MDNSSSTPTTAQQTENTGSEQVFTQEQVNNIVRERLAREHSKSAASEDITARETDLKAREDALNARLAKLDCDAKSAELASILKEIGVYAPRISPILEDSKRAEAMIQSMELDEGGKVKNRGALLNRAKADFADFIATVKTVGAPVDHPMDNEPRTPDSTLIKRAFGLKG